MIDIVGIIIVCVGIAFDLLGCIGLIRLPDVYNRLQAATKCVTLGTCGIMFGIFILSGFSGLGVRSLICIPFIFLTSPTAAHALARGAHTYSVGLWDKSRMDEYKEEKSRTANHR